MSVDRLTGAPAGGDQVDPLPEWKVDLVGGRQVSEQAHPECRQSLVIKAIRAVMAGEPLYIEPHSFKRLFGGHPGHVAERDGDMGQMSKLGGGNSGSFKSLDERGHLIVAREIARLQEWKVRSRFPDVGQVGVIDPQIGRAHV